MNISLLYVNRNIELVGKGDGGMFCFSLTRFYSVHTAISWKIMELGAGKTNSIFSTINTHKNVTVVIILVVLED